MSLACRLILRRPLASTTTRCCISTSSTSSLPIIKLSTGGGNWHQRNNHLLKPKVLLRFKAIRSIASQTRGVYVDPKFSYAFGKSSGHLIYTTGGRELDRQIDETPDDVVFVCHAENKSVTLRQLDKDINKLLKTLVKRFNVKRGDTVGIFAYNCYNWLVIQFACVRVGAILTPLNPSYKPDELAYILDKSKIKFLFLPGPGSEQAELNNHMEVLQSEEVLKMNKAGKLKLKDVFLMDSNIDYKISNNCSSDNNGASKIQLKLDNVQLHNWNSLIQNDGRVFRSRQDAEEAGLVTEQELGEACIVDPYSVSPDDVFAIYYTSGTTGRPKGACVTHFACVNNLRILNSKLRQGFPANRPIIMATTLPMFHIYAGLLIAMGPLTGNIKVVFSSHKYDVSALIEATIKHKANLLVGTPTILIDSLLYVKQHKLAGQLESLKKLQSGGAYLSPQVVSQAFKILPQLEDIRVGYGSSENASIATFQSIHEPAEMRPFTVGQPIDFTEVRIVMAKTDKVVELGQRGEIQTRGHNIMIGYLNQPDKTQEVLSPSRWYRTGDVGFMHPNGSVQVCGRLKHMIIKGGENIYPEELEQMIHKLDFVIDVHVVGVPDKRYGEQVCAWIKLKPGYRGEETLVGEQLVALDGKQSEEGIKVITRDDIIKYCKANITYFKVPKYVLFVDEFPMTATKKVQNNVITEISCKLLNLKLDEAEPAFSKSSS